MPAPFGRGPRSGPLVFRNILLHISILKLLLSIFYMDLPITLRKSCLICQSSELTQILPTDTSLPLGCFPVKDLSFPCHIVPYNAVHCSSCGVVQTKYIGNIDLVYGHNFAGICGTTRGVMNTLFADFILETPKLSSIVEIGAGNGEVSDIVLEKKNSLKYSIVDPAYWGNQSNRTILKSFFEDITEDNIQTPDTVVMSHVFEHFYSPFNILKKIASLKSVSNILLNWPNLEEFVKGRTYNVLNMEHIFYAENKYIEQLFELVGFKVSRVYAYNKFAIFYHFERDPSISCVSSIFPTNQSSLQDVHSFFDYLFEKIKLFNSILESKPEVPAYIWPCSVHTSFCFMAGLQKNRIKNILDNSPEKINCYQYGFTIPCISFRQTIETPEKKIIFLVGGQYTKEVYDKCIENPENMVFTL